MSLRCSRWFVVPRPLLSLPTRRSSDLNVAAAARDEARARLAQAVALVGAGNRDLERARGAFSDGQAALAAGDHARALREFRSEEHTSELQSRRDLVCRLLLEKKKPISS